MVAWRIGATRAWVTNTLRPISVGSTQGLDTEMLLTAG